MCWIPFLFDIIKMEDYTYLFSFDQIGYKGNSNEDGSSMSDIFEPVPFLIGYKAFINADFKTVLIVVFIRKKRRNSNGFVGK